MCCESGFTWRCSPPDPTDNVFYFPDIPATVSEIESPAPVPSHSDSVYIYQVPTDSLSCSGAVTGVEYCYQPERDPNGIDSDVIFTLLIFDELSSSTTDMDFTEIPIPTPGVNPNCFSSVCCDSYSFTGEGFSLQSNNFIYRILTPSSGHRVLGFHTSVANFLVNGYFFVESVLRTQPLNLPGKQNIVMHNVLNTSLSFILFLDQGSGPINSTTDSTTPNNPDTSTPTSSQFQGEGESILPIAMGVVVGLTVLVVLLCMSVVIIVMYISRSRSEDQKLTSPNGNDRGSNGE